ncbi:Bug family tripartite tricarboxylate transporter substrate binding protein [Hydrogenophaga sp. BPS33]|uniref:Bug family tripartite tricarboxylate transporter substrate binding protein n=1 Tax=Hydrogenophaga sp. BPS33 TaxID=2651974 RepID=UPI00131F7110|nr:tripartite tricarboxylate transporter substrate binding protein [Hydrogenophaga sp. BPS33]QHE87813.1 tripartite tricarboxylate transporter substrate binding protein [Hydrogenophaga sp. BPS33]
MTYLPAPRRRTLLRAGVLAAATFCAGTALAQATYPSRPITMLLPLAAGSAGDVALRVVAQKMSENMKQSIVIENLPGVSGLLGTERVVRAAPDGYLIGGIGDSVLNFAANLAPKMNFDPIHDLDPIALVATIPWTIAVNPGFGTKTLGEFIAKAKAAPHKIDYASTGSGSASHIGMEMLAARTGIALTHIPYKGATPGVTDVVGGQVPAVFSAVSVVLPHVKSGKLLALGIPADQRSALLPETPTFAEAGVPNFSFVTWVSLFAPKGTPKAIVDKLNAETVKAVADPAVREKLLSLGLEPQTSTPEQLGQMVRSGHARVAKIVQDANIKID